jgi:hypothetical protein
MLLESLHTYHMRDKRKGGDVRQQINLRLDAELLDAVEELRRFETPIPTKSEVIRRAILNELERAQAKAKRAKA